MLTSERPPRIIFLSSSSLTTSATTTTTTSSLSPHHQHHHQQQQQQHQQPHQSYQQQQQQQQNQNHLQHQQNQMRRSSSKSVKEYSFSSNGSNTTTSSSSATPSSTNQTSSIPIGCPRERKSDYSRQNYQLSSSLNYCQQRDNYSSNQYRHSIKECDNRGKNKKVESGGWHTSSCKLPSTRQILSETTEFEVPTICVTSDNRRTSISSNLRFTRTFSTDSVDSLERQCMKEVRRQRIMDEIELKVCLTGASTKKH
jgi:hypothetical protein